MATLIAWALLFGAGVGIGILLIIAGLRGQPIMSIALGNDTGPSDEPFERDRRVTGTTISREMLVGGVAAGAVITLLTGWLAAGVVVVIGVYLFPKVYGNQGHRREWLEKTRAIATWTEMLRDTMAAADGVEEAIAATVPIAPMPIRREVGLLDARRRSEQPLTEALAAFGAEVDHPSADVVVAALSSAAAGEGSDFVSVLTRLAALSRDEMKMWQKVEAARAQLHTAVRIIIGVIIVTIVLVAVIAPDFLEPYAKPAGQFWLCVDALVLMLGIVLLDRMSNISLPERFTPRRQPRVGASP